MGLQLVGPPDGDAAVLAAAVEFERAHPYAAQLPLDVVVAHRM